MCKVDFILDLGASNTCDGHSDNNNNRLRTSRSPSTNDVMFGLGTCILGDRSWAFYALLYPVSAGLRQPAELQMHPSLPCERYSSGGAFPAMRSESACHGVDIRANWRSSEVNYYACFRYRLIQAGGHKGFFFLLPPG